MTPQVLHMTVDVEWGDICSRRTNGPLAKEVSHNPLKIQPPNVELYGGISGVIFSSYSLRLFSLPRQVNSREITQTKLNCILMVFMRFLHYEYA